MKKHKIITLCGSSKFKDDFMKQNERLTLLGNVVISLGVFAHADGKLISKSDKILLDSIHKQKIEMADEIFVINKGGYIGESTQNEILYAMHYKKPIRYMENRN